MTSAPRGDQGSAKRPWWRRLIRVLVLAIVWPLVFVGTLVGSAILHLDSAPARRELCDRVEPLMNDALAGDFEVRCVEISPDRIELADFVARDPSGHVVLRVERAAVDISRRDLFFGRLVVESVRVTNPYADLSPNELTGELRIAEAFTPVDPAPEDPNAKEPNIPHIVVHDVLLEGGEIVHLSPELDARGIRLHAEGVVDDRIDVTVHDLDGEVVDRAGEVIAAIERFDGEVSFLEPGAESDVELRIDGYGEDYLDGHVKMVWGDPIPRSFEGAIDFHASPETLVRAGIPQVGDILQSAVSGSASAEVDLDGTMVASAHLETEGGDLEVHAELAEAFERIDAHVETTGLDLAEVLVPVDQGRFEGSVDAQMHPPGEDGRRRVVVDGREIAFLAPDGNTYQAPALHVAAYLGEDHVELLELDVPHLEGDTGHLDVTGRIGFDGAVDVNVDASLPNLAADPNLAQLVPGRVAGGLTVDARVRLDPQNGFEVDAEGHVSGRNLRLPWFDAEHLDVRGRVSGRPPAPVADVRVQLRGFEAGDFRIATADLSVDGGSQGAGPGRYHVQGEVDGALPEAEVDGTVDLMASVDDGGVTVDGTTELRGLWDTPIVAELDQVRYDSRGLTAQGIQIRSGDGMGVAATGYLDLTGNRSDARVQLTNVDLEKIARRFGIDLGLRGVASAEIAFRGSTEAPILDTTGRVEGFQIAGVAFQVMRWDVDIQQGERGTSFVVAQLAVESEGNGSAELDARGRVPARNPLRALADAYWDATFTADELRLGLLPELIAGLPEVHGRVDARVTLDGTIQDPERLGVTVEAREAGIPGFAAVNVALESALEGDDLRLGVQVMHPTDEVLVGVEARASDFEILEVATSDRPLAFLADPWTLEIVVPERPVSQFPEPLAFPAPMTASLRARFAGGGARVDTDSLGKPQAPGYAAALENVHGRVEAWARYDEELRAGCAEGQPEMNLVAVLEDGQTEVRLSGEIGGRENLLLRATADTPVDQWAVRPPTSIPEVQMELETRRLPLHSVPYVCRYARGELDLDLEGRDIFGASPEVALQALIDGLSVEQSEPLRFEVEAGLDSDSAFARAEMRARDRVALRLEGHAPMRWGGETLIPEARPDGPWEVSADFDRMPVAPLLAAVPILSDPRGHLDGQMRARGVGREAVARGSIAMQEVAFVVRQPYLRIEGLNGELGLDDEGVRISGIRFTDRDGEARIDGRIALDGWMPSHAQLTVRTDDFPLRVEGVIYAYLDTRTEIAADLDPERNVITIAMERTAIRLPQDIGRSIQPLAQHEDVIYEDQPAFDRNAPVEVVAADDPAGAMAFADETLIKVRSQPFWVRRDDFSVQVRPRIDISITPTGVRMSGPVEIRRGFIAFMGKEFDFKRGEVRFTGGNSIDPRVEIEATHDLGGGEIITARITGALLKPELEFSSSRDPNISNSEAIQLLVRGRAGGSSEAASQQAASFLTGMFAGVLSSVTRREVGEYIPIFGIESEGGNTTLRVGFQADQLIPEALDDVILGAYVEGYFGGGTGNTTGGSAVSGGAVIEFILPRNLVWTGTYDVPTNWSTDLMWEP